MHENGRLPVVNFAAGGVAAPADAALMMQLGAEGVFVGSGIFKSGDPAKRAAAIVKAVTNYADAKLIAELSTDLGEAMVGINENEIALLDGRARQVKWRLDSGAAGRLRRYAAVLDKLGVPHFEIRPEARSGSADEWFDYSGWRKHSNE